MPFAGAQVETRLPTERQAHAVGGGGHPRDPAQGGQGRGDAAARTVLGHEGEGQRPVPPERLAQPRVGGAEGADAEQGGPGELLGEVAERRSQQRAITAGAEQGRAAERAGERGVAGTRLQAQGELRGASDRHVRVGGGSRALQGKRARRGRSSLHPQRVGRPIGVRPASGEDQLQSGKAARLGCRCPQGLGGVAGCLPRQRGRCGEGAGLSLPPREALDAALAITHLATGIQSLQLQCARRAQPLQACVRAGRRRWRDPPASGRPWPGTRARSR